MASPTDIPFVMHGARVAIADGLLHIEEHVKGIELAVNKKDENLGLAFDLAKAVIESACQTILADRNVAFETTDNLPKLFKRVTHTLPFLPVTESGSVEIRRSLVQTLSGLHTAIQGVCELRNACGFASHGSEGARPALELVQAVLAAETADAIVGFLYRIHRQSSVSQKSFSLLYDNNREFNGYVDEIHERVRIFQEDFAPSKILFELAPEPYRLSLSEYESSLSEDDAEEDGAPEEEPSL